MRRSESGGVGHSRQERAQAGDPFLRFPVRGEIDAFLDRQKQIEDRQIAPLGALDELLDWSLMQFLRSL